MNKNKLPKFFQEINEHNLFQSDHEMHKSCVDFCNLIFVRKLKVNKIFVYFIHVDCHWEVF